MFVRAKNAFFHARTFCVFEGWVNTNILEETPTLENAVSRHRLRRNNALLINQFRLYFTFGSGICFIVILTIAFTAVNTVRTAKPTSVNTRILSVGVGGGAPFWRCRSSAPRLSAIISSRLYRSSEKFWTAKKQICRVLTVNLFRTSPGDSFNVRTVGFFCVLIINY